MAKVAVPVAKDFEDVELTEPVARLKQAGHDVVLLGKKAGESVGGKRGKASVTIEARAADRDPSEFDAMMIPGGYSPDQLRTDEGVVRFVREFFESGKPVAAICHAPQLLIEAGVVKGKTMTSWPSVKTDLINGLPPGEGTFTVCSFWMARCLAQAGRSTEGWDLFEQMLAYRNDVGLLAEEIEPGSGAALGNFPQGFSHVGLIDTGDR